MSKWESCSECGTVNKLDKLNRFNYSNRKEIKCQCGMIIQTDGSKDSYI